MNILEEAQKVVSERRDNYGGPEVNFQRIAAMWKVILKEYPITQTEVALMMIAVKMCRQMHSPHRDNWTDIAGYAECGNLVSEVDTECDHLGVNLSEGDCLKCGRNVVRNEGGKWVLSDDPENHVPKKACQHPPEKVNPLGPRAYCHHCQQYVIRTTIYPPDREWVTAPKDTKCKHENVGAGPGVPQCTRCGKSVSWDTDLGAWKALDAIQEA